MEHRPNSGQDNGTTGVRHARGTEGTRCRKMNSEALAQRKRDAHTDQGKTDCKKKKKRRRSLNFSFHTRPTAFAGDVQVQRRCSQLSKTAIGNKAPDAAPLGQKSSMGQGIHVPFTSPARSCLRRAKHGILVSGAGMQQSQCLLVASSFQRGRKKPC